MLNEKANKPMNKFNQYLKHKGHLERLYLSKSLINNKCPMIPSFFKKGLKNKGNEIETQYKINNDNKMLLKKIINTVNSKSKYNKLNNIPSKCPAFERKDIIQVRKFKNIVDENYLFYKILRRTKSTLDNSKNEEDFFHSRYYKYNICRNNSISNPNLFFSSYRQFSKKVTITLKKQLFNRTVNNSCNKLNKNESKRYKIFLSGVNHKVNSSLE